jgi:hypothetical protein
MNYAKMIEENKYRGVVYKALIDQQLTISCSATAKLRSITVYSDLPLQQETKH